ncbi:hypothetical protein DI396_09585 [Litorivita pollutaquae]|uniref:Porin domain-containing protein n=1 Tax=Litorivita pollutaquae TaxID=2200892 RepID=A0A2V4NSC3_9RHOB|nr:porin [Litorivita pollutaquae]PYC47676.1 hypothetical protein DI396_09585 [Litorivita pollutaquae]
MKKILFATTALVATAGVASADVSFSGNAAFGALKVAGADDFEIAHRIDLYARGTAETDTGLSFHAIVEFEQLENTGVAADKTGDNDTTTIIGMSAGNVTVQYGNTDGAIDKNTSEAYRIRGVDFEGWGGRVDNKDDGEILRMDYVMDALRVSLSYADTDEAAGIGFSYTADLGGTSVNIGLGYEDGDQGDLAAITLGAQFGAFGARIGYWDGSEDNAEQVDISVQYQANDLTLWAEYLMNETADTDNYTVGATYNLGGGATVFAQVGTRDTAALGDEQEFASFGVAFGF